jgi:competence protein ComEC
MRIPHALLGLLVLSLIFCGCLGEQPQPPPIQNGTQQVNVTPPPVNLSNVSIIITKQENQSVAQNYTPPPVAPPAVWTGINYTLEPNASLAVYFIYVGDQQSKLQGDAVLIRKGDFSMLVDAGPAETGGRVVDFLRERGIEDLEVLVSTNADPYHYGGIRGVTSQYGIQEFWWSGKSYGDQAYESMISNVSAGAKRVRVLGRGYNVTLNGINITVLNPAAKPFDDVNNDAIALRIQDRNFSLLLLSGVQFGAQSEMLNNEKGLLETNVMQAPYYGLGAGTSGIANFLKALSPKVVVVSGGPDDSAASGGSRQPFRKLMDEDGIAYYENYLNSTVRVISDGRNYSVGYFS